MSVKMGSTSRCLRTIEINHMLFDIVLEEEFSEKLNSTDGTIYLGLTEFVPRPTIILRKGMCYENMRRTIIHELIHAFVYANGHSINCEEDMCVFIGAHIDDVMKYSEKILDDIIHLGGT